MKFCPSEERQHTSLGIKISLEIFCKLDTELKMAQAVELENAMSFKHWRLKTKKTVQAVPLPWARQQAVRAIISEKMALIGARQQLWEALKKLRSGVSVHQLYG